MWHGLRAKLGRTEDRTLVRVPLLRRQGDRSVRPTYFGEGLVDFHDLNLIAETSPAAEHVGIFLRDMTGLVRLPITQEEVVGLVVAIEQITAISFGGKNGAEFAEGGERGNFFAGNGLPDGNGEDLLHKG